MGSFIQPSALYIIFTPNGSTHELRAVRYHLALGGEHDQLRVASGMDSEAPWAFNTWISVSTPLSQGMCELLQLADPHVENEARIRAFRSAIERDLEINLPNSQRSVRDIYRLMLTKAPAVQAGIRDHIELILRILFPNEEYWTVSQEVDESVARMVAMPFEERIRRCQIVRVSYCCRNGLRMYSLDKIEPAPGRQRYGFSWALH